jgi:hypothetical protein
METGVICSINAAEELAETADASTARSRRNVKIDSVNLPGSFSIELRNVNDPLTNVHPDGQTVVRSIKKGRPEFDRAIRSFTRYYMAEHGDQSRGPELDADDASLASKYVETVIYDVDPNPTQMKLSKLSGLSQATWSRAFHRRAFWEEVDKRIDALWHLHSLVQENIERLSYEQEVAARRVIEGKDDKDANTGRNYVEDAANGRIDLQQYERMDKEQLVRVIKKRRPSVKTEDLEKMSPSHLLRAIARIEEGE